MSASTPIGPVLFAYDGSDHAKAAIEVAGSQLASGRPAVVVTVWEPLDSVPFYGALVSATPELGEAARAEAQRVADEGAELARQAGFDASVRVVPGAPTWSGIVDAADELEANLIVMGSHGRSGISAVVMGSVATAVAHHGTRPLLIVPLRG
jgi:nucleotide-binding universal stress UspA family protein